MLPCVIWFTGLSGAGKTTLATALVKALESSTDFKIEHLDGDAIRAIFPQTGFSHDERESHIKWVGFAASLLEKNGGIAVVSLVSPYQSSRQFARGLARNFVEIHVSTPLAVCEMRDVKGLYARARRGEIRNFTGIDDPYEIPSNPELRVDTTEVPFEKSLKQILDYLERYGSPTDARR